MAGIGILGGTFDPIHLGHLRSAWEASVQLSLDAVHFMPCSQPVHRPSPIATAEQRLAMVQKSIAPIPHWVANDLEVSRQAPSYTVDTLRQLRAQWGDQLPLWWLVGSDAFTHFLSWRAWQEVLQLAHVAVMVRAGDHAQYAPVLTTIVAQGEQVPTSAAAGAIRHLQLTPLWISSTQIRAACAAGNLPYFLVTDAVLTDIQVQGLYGWSAASEDQNR